METQTKNIMDAKKIAIITTSKFHFDIYVSENNLNPKNVKQVKVLSDIQGEIFDYAVEIEGFENVTQYVIDRVKLRN